MAKIAIMIFLAILTITAILITIVQGMKEDNLNGDNTQYNDNIISYITIILYMTLDNL